MIFMHVEDHITILIITDEYLFLNTVEHLNIAALKNVTLSLNATLKTCDLIPPRSLVFGDPHLICCSFLENDFSQSS